MDALYDLADGDVPEEGITISEAVVAGVLRRIYERKYGKRGTDELDSRLFAATKDVFNHAAATGIAEAMNTGAPAPPEWFLHRIDQNNAIFSAFRTHRMQRDVAAKMFDAKGKIKPFDEFRRDVTPIIGKYRKDWLRTEYATAVQRARLAADWQQFVEEADVFPNLEWVPSTAIHPGADHRIFWNTIRPVGDAFWDAHRPGDRYNCQCDLRQTDLPENDVPTIPINDIKNSPAPGLDNNPGKDGKLFNDSHPYFATSCTSCPFVSMTKKLLALAGIEERDCYECRMMSELLSEIDKKGRWEVNKRDYHRYKESDDYINVAFDKKSGGVKAIHKGHAFHDKPNEERFFNGLTASDLEMECQDRLFKMGHSAILLDESKEINGCALPSLDLMLDGVVMDIKAITGKGWYSHALKKKNIQLINYNNREDVENLSDTLCLYFHEAQLFDENNMINSILYFKNYRHRNGELINVVLKRVYCVINGRDDIIIYDIK